MALHRSHVEAGLVPNRKKRSLSTIDEPTTPQSQMAGTPTEQEERDPVDLVQSIVEEAEADLPDVEALLDSITINPPPTLSANPRHTRKIALADLFLYPEASAGNSEEGLAFYWKGGVRNLETELTQYDEEQRDENEVEETGSPVTEFEVATL